MIFWISLILLVAGVAALIANVIGESVSWKYEHSSLCVCALLFGTIASFFGGLLVLILGFVLVVNLTTATATKLANVEKYKALTYKLESDACRDQFGLLNKEIIDEVQEWNTGIVYYKAMDDNFWVGIYYPDVYGDLGTIDYETYEDN